MPQLELPAVLAGESAPALRGRDWSPEPSEIEASFAQGHHQLLVDDPRDGVRLVHVVHRPSGGEQIGYELRERGSAHVLVERTPVSSDGWPEMRRVVSAMLRDRGFAICESCGGAGYTFDRWDGETWEVSACVCGLIEPHSVVTCTGTRESHEGLDVYVFEGSIVVLYRNTMMHGSGGACATLERALEVLRGGRKRIERGTATEAHTETVLYRHYDAASEERFVVRTESILEVRRVAA